MMRPRFRHSRLRDGRAGFTLFELLAVMFIIALVLAVTAPQLIPIIAYSEAEGAARHLANYGRAAMAHAAMMKDDLAIRVDLDNQELFAVHWVIPVDEEEQAKAAEDAPPDQMQLLTQYAEKEGLSQQELQAKVASGDLSGLPEGFDPQLLNQQLDDKFNRFHQRALMVRAKNVKHDESLLAQVDIFDKKKFKIEEEKEPVEEEITDPIIGRTRFGGSGWIESVEIDGVRTSHGTAEIQISALGLASHVRFYVVSEDGDYFTVSWDPVSGTSNFYYGLREDAI
jgi:prepilin-type N-terminal cleavage/methylation domain-containing protein